MRDFIMKSLAEMQGKNDNNASQDAIENDAILECAHLIQELDDLTLEGQDINKMRDIDAVDIPIDDDGVIDSLEFSISSGTISDIPADVLVHSESYEYMKSREDFVQETVSENPRQYMEEDAAYHARITEAVNEKYNQYLETIFQEGLFSSNKVHLGDPSIKWSVDANFGPSNPDDPSSAQFTTKLNVAYESVNHKDKILIKQKDSVTVLCENHPEIFKNCVKFYLEFYAKHNIDIPKGRSLFDVMVPKRVLVPVQPIDYFIVYIEAENVLSQNKDDDFFYIQFGLPIKQKKTYGATDMSVTSPAGASINSSVAPHVTLKSMMDKTAFMKECYREKTPIGRYVQEAIDFGGGDTSGDATDSGVTAGGNDAPPAPGNGTETPAAADDTQTVDTNATPDASTNGGAVEIPSNDISGDIASDVQQTIDDQANPDTAANTPDEGGDNGMDNAVTDIPETDDLNDNANIDSSALDTVPNGDVDAALDSLDDAGNEQAAEDDSAMNTDTSSMSMDEIKQAAIDKLNKMPLDQVQAFLNDDNADLPTSDEPVSEAFILTPKNINAELDVCLRNALGDLNDNKKEFGEIISSFKKDGKKLNRALTKASKMDKVYSEPEMKQFIKLNKCVADLVVTLRPDIGKKEINVAKRLIKAFTSQAVSVGKIIEKHKNDNSEGSKGPERVVD